MDIQKFKALCWQGNVIESIDYIKSLKSTDRQAIQLANRLHERFISQTEEYDIDSHDPWIKKVVKCYFAYFRKVLTNNNEKIAENKLITDLLGCLDMQKGSAIEEIETQLESIFREKGYSFLGGITKPYRGPYIWKTTKKRVFEVSLPSGTQEVTVYILSEFLLLSWPHYASLGITYSGGWCKEEGLYYVNSDSKDIDTESVDFQVWFLKHEAQHLSDYKRYPNLNSVNLEYRAKLIELMYHPNPNKVVDKYIKEQKNDVRAPHSYAAYIIMSGLSELIFHGKCREDAEQWKAIEPEKIKDSATRLFYENEQQLQIEGCKTKGAIKIT